jgi:sulfur-oxidizing protein SoxX
VGDLARGQQVFVKHDCIQCHLVLGETDIAVTREREPPIILGADSAMVKTYAQLVTSIINPSHRVPYSRNWQTSDKDGNSIMRNYNDVMTVSELIDVVAYLQTHYKVTPMHIPKYEDYQKLREDAAKTR